MKYILCLLCLLLYGQNASTQDLDSLNGKMIGTWELVNYLSTNNGTGNESPDKIKRTRVITPSHFTLTLYNPETGQMIGNVTGSYFLSAGRKENKGQSDGTYQTNEINLMGDITAQEKAISVTQGMESLFDKTFLKSVTIDEGDRLIYTWISNDVKYTEIWTRVVTEPVAKPFSGNTSLSQKIVGAWDLLKFDYGHGKTSDQQKGKFRRLKLYNGSSYTVTDINVNTYMTNTAFLGNYVLNKNSSIKGNYQEDRFPVSNTIPKQAENKFTASVFIDAENQLHIEWMSEGIKSSEVWIRLKK